jgi:hypothetical protein
MQTPKATNKDSSAKAWVIAKPVAALRLLFQNSDNFRQATAGHQKIRILKDASPPKNHLSGAVLVVDFASGSSSNSTRPRNNVASPGYKTKMSFCS